MQGEPVQSTEKLIATGGTVEKVITYRLSVLTFHKEHTGSTHDWRQIHEQANSTSLDRINRVGYSVRVC